MNVALCKVKLRLPSNGTLKGKRQVYQSISSRVHQRFNVSIAEISTNENHRLLTLGISCTSNSSRHANEIISNVVDYIYGLRGDAELLDYELELMAGL